jgi:hypothetical protein
MAGSEMITIEELMVATSIPRVVLERTTHLYRPAAASSRPPVRPAGIRFLLACAPNLTLT